jgi:two-component sensor histidine kinase
MGRWSRSGPRTHSAARSNLADVANGSLEAFPLSQIDVAGPHVDISPRHALALSMAFHELATNAAKYGALSSAEGRVRLHWRVDDDNRLHLDWQELGGPPVVEPSSKGFGSRLLERLLVRDLGGEIRLDYDPAGLKFAITAPL